MSRPDGPFRWEGGWSLDPPFRRIVSFDPGTTNGVFCTIYNRPGCAPEIYYDNLPLTPKGRVDYEAVVDSDPLAEEGHTLYVIEDVWVMPKQGVVSSAKFVEAYAVVKALMTRNVTGHPTCKLVGYRPQEWKKIWQLEKSKSSSCELMTQEWPSTREFLQRYSPKTGRKLKGLDHNRADAFLLALTNERLYRNS